MPNVSHLIINSLRSNIFTARVASFSPALFLWKSKFLTSHANQRLHLRTSMVQFFKIWTECKIPFWQILWIRPSVREIHAYKHTHTQKDVNNTDVTVVHGYVWIAKIAMDSHTLTPGPELTCFDVFAFSRDVRLWLLFMDSALSLYSAIRTIFALR